MLLENEPEFPVLVIMLSLPLLEDTDERLDLFALDAFPALCFPDALSTLLYVEPLPVGLFLNVSEPVLVVLVALLLCCPLTPLCE